MREREKTENHLGLNKPKEPRRWKKMEGNFLHCH